MVPTTHFCFFVEFRAEIFEMEYFIYVSVIVILNYLLSDSNFWIRNNPQRLYHVSKKFLLQQNVFGPSSTQLHSLFAAEISLWSNQCLHDADSS